MKYDIERIAKLLNLVDGMFHLQIMIKDDIPYIIDVTRRIPGDLYPYLIEYCDGVEYSKAVVKSYTTGIIDNEFDKRLSKQRFVIRHCVMPNANGLYKNIIIDSSIKDKILYRFDILNENTIIKNYFQTQLSIIFIELKSIDYKIINTLNTLITPNIL